MLTVIDPAVFVPMLSSSHSKHEEFKILKDWLLKGSGISIMGGTKYRNELQKIPSTLGFISELDRSGRIKRYQQGIVDEAAEYAKAKAATTNFDDEHLVALISVSEKCKVVCVDDKRSHKYLKDKDLYKNKCNIPKIFCGEKTAGVLGGKPKSRRT